MTNILKTFSITWNLLKKKANYMLIFLWLIGFRLFYLNLIHQSYIS